MARAALTQTVEVQQQINLAPRQILQLRKALQNCQRVQAKIKALKAELKNSVGEVEDLMAEANVENLEFEGFKAKIVAGVRNAFNLELFAKKGGNVALYNKCIEEKPVSAYVKVTAPGDKDSDD